MSPVFILGILLLRSATFPETRITIRCQFARLLHKSGICFHIENQLCNAVAIAKVNKSHSSQVARTLHPAG